MILRWNGHAWKLVPSPDPERLYDLYGVAATSARSGWAVGCWSCVSAPYQALILRWNGTSWKRVLTPGGLLFGVAATSARSAWAVGYNGNLSSPKILIEHWNGKAWT